MLPLPTLTVVEHCVVLWGQTQFGQNVGVEMNEAAPGWRGCFL